MHEKKINSIRATANVARMNKMTAGTEVQAPADKRTADSRVGERVAHLQAELKQIASKPTIPGYIHGVAPEGWEDTVVKMKQHPEIDNPWALAWWMQNEGYSPKA